MSNADRERVEAEVRQTLVTACDLSKPGVLPRLLSLYPDSGIVVSATAGRVSTTRTALAGGIRSFWDNVGQNMRQPRWEWRTMDITVLSPSAAVVTATYRIPHLTPMGKPHVVGGAWTAVFQRLNGRWTIVQEHLSDSPAP